jgi:serine/threonine protein phosphatase PrpC
MTTTIEFAELTHAGLRETNEDAVGVTPFGTGVDDGIVFMMADGVGASPGGATASRMAVEAVASALAMAPRQWPAHRRLRTAVESANLAIYDRALTDPELRRMRTTLTATALVGGEVVVAHVGDCRTYLLRAGRLTCLTRDHNWAGQLARLGLMGRDAARGHRHRHLLTRCLGQHPIVRVDVVHQPLYLGDVLCQCSDGLHCLMAEAELAAALGASGATGACAALVERSRARGADDNVSVQIAAVRGAGATPAGPTRRVPQGQAV